MMMNSVAVLADVHGVLPVLDAVLAEPEVLAADRVVVCGDHAAGPQPVQVLDRLMALDRAVLVRGNADRELVALARGEQSTVGEPYEADVWAAAQLSPSHVELLAGLPHPVVLEVSGFGPVVFCHGTPRDDNEVVLVDTRLVVNPGSVGMPYGRAGGHWALLRDGEVSMRRTEIDADAAVAAVVAGSAYPGRADWADTYIRARLSDADALTAFGPRDGRSTCH